MKRFISVLALLLVMAVSAKAMSYKQARQQALFLTDKREYELNLSDAQYCSTGSIAHTLPRPISTVRSTGMPATGTSVSTPATRTATTTSSTTVHACSLSIAEATHGE